MSSIAFVLNIFNIFRSPLIWNISIKDEMLGKLRYIGIYTRVATFTVGKGGRWWRSTIVGVLTSSLPAKEWERK